MISKRVKGLVDNGSAIREMFEAGKRLATIHGAENVYDFSIGNPYYAPPEAIKDAVIEVVSTDDPMALHGYPPNPGFPEVRQAVADNLNRRFGSNYEVPNIVMAPGASSALTITFGTLCDPEDEVITIAPYFFEYNQYAATFNAKIVPVATKPEDGFMPDVDAIVAAVTERTKIVLINSPNNPTGVIYSAEVMKKLGEALDAKQKELGISVYIVADEPYRELAFDNTEVPFIPDFYKNTIICYSWSKSLSMPGDRIGYIAVNPAADEADLVSAGLASAIRALGFVNASTISQLAVARCLDESTDIAAYDANRKLLYSIMCDCGFECAYPAGAFYMWVKTPIAGADFVALCKEHNILLVPGASFGYPDYVRLAYCVSNDMIARSRVPFMEIAKACGTAK